MAHGASRAPGRIAAWLITTRRGGPPLGASAPFWLHSRLHTQRRAALLGLAGSPRGSVSLPTGLKRPLCSHHPPASSQPYLFRVTCYPESFASMLCRQSARVPSVLPAASLCPSDLGGRAGQPVEPRVRSPLGCCCSHPQGRGVPPRSSPGEGIHTGPQAARGLLPPPRAAGVQGATVSPGQKSM